jgi:hypothetical protein
MVGVFSAHDFIGKPGKIGLAAIPPDPTRVTKTAA